MGLRRRRTQTIPPADIALDLLMEDVMTPRRSDEPTRLAEYIAKVFRLDTARSDVRTGPGATARTVVGADAQDDCAVLRMTGEQDLVVGSDYVRGPKFRLYQMGF